MSSKAASKRYTLIACCCIPAQRDTMDCDKAYQKLYRASNFVYSCWLFVWKRAPFSVFWLWHCVVHTRACRYHRDVAAARAFCGWSYAYRLQTPSFTIAFSCL